MDIMTQKQIKTSQDVALLELDKVSVPREGLGHESLSILLRCARKILSFRDPALSISTACLCRGRDSNPHDVAIKGF